MRSRILPFAVVALLLIGSKASAYVTPGPMFEAPGYLYSAGPTANVVLADVNLDGRADLVVGTSNDFSVALATAAGSFGTFQHFHPEWGGVEVGVGDFDGDGLPDVAGRNDTTLFVAFGDGAGGWPTSFSTPAPDRPFLLTTLRVADVNGDGRSDVAGFNRDSTLSVFLGQADRTLVTTGTIAFASGLSPQSFAIGDVTGSTAPDLVVTFYENQFVAILPGNGDGTFGGEVDVATPTDPDGVALGAADAGAPLDLFLHANVDGILYASGSGGGTFGPFSTLSGSDIGFELVLQDFNHDGNLDVATYDQRRPRSVATFLGDGLGGFGTRVDSPELIYPLYSFVSGDVDGDGNPDLAGVQNPTFPGFAVMRGHADGSFGDGPAAPPRITGSLRAAAGDFDNDGKVDAVGWNDVSKKLAFARGHGDGTFDPFVESAALPLAYAFGAAGRFDADANLDLVLVSTAAGKLSYLHGNGNGTFAAPVDWTVCGGEPTIVDLNADGRLDVVVLCKGLNTLSVLMQGAGGLTAPVTSATPPGPVAVRYADLNGDGRLDRVLACTNQVVEQFDDGLGGWTTVLTHAQSPSPLDVALADVDEDGFLDAISNDDNGGTLNDVSPILHVLHGQAGGVFGTETTVNVDYDPGTDVQIPRSMAHFLARDLDGDGHVDLLGRGSSTMYMAARGHGDGTFERAESYIGPAMARSLDLGDFDGDGALDALGAGIDGSAPNSTTTIMVLRNRAGGVVAVPPVTHPASGIALSAPFPNPARTSSTLRFSVPSREAVAIDVISVGGRRVLSRSLVPAAAGSQSYSIAGLDRLATGVYSVVVSQGERRASTRLVVLP